MTAFANLSFELGSLGAPTSWNVVSTASVRRIYPFAALTQPMPWESFNSEWSNNDAYKLGFVGVGTDLVPASFTTIASTPKYAENFEEKWLQNENYVFSLNALDAVFLGIGGAASSFETFEGHWSNNDSYKYAFVGVGSDLTAATFVGQTPTTAEGFETSWMTPAFKMAFVGVGTDLTAASFVTSTTPVSYEGFETTWLAMTTV